MVIVNRLLAIANPITIVITDPITGVITDLITGVITNLITTVITKPPFGYNRPYNQIITRQRDLRLSKDNLARPALTVSFPAKPKTIITRCRNFFLSQELLKFVS